MQLKVLPKDDFATAHDLGAIRLQGGAARVTLL